MAPCHYCAETSFCCGVRACSGYFDSPDSTVRFVLLLAEGVHFLTSSESGEMRKILPRRVSHSELRKLFCSADALCFDVDATDMEAYCPANTTNKRQHGIVHH
uniref:Uncharacterized protein n=1 Tax=Panthera leo TaxID=9689 RepID=A0A8C8WEP5_PANLE